MKCIGIFTTRSQVHKQIYIEIDLARIGRGWSIEIWNFLNPFTPSFLTTKRRRVVLLILNLLGWNFRSDDVSLIIFEFGGHEKSSDLIKWALLCRCRGWRGASRNTLRCSSAYSPLCSARPTREREGRRVMLGGARGSKTAKPKPSQLRGRVCETVKTMQRCSRLRLRDCYLLLCYETAVRVQGRLVKSDTFSTF